MPYIVIRKLWGKVKFGGYNSRIRDADMAQEMMRLTQANVLQQAATAMLAQGNQAPQAILQLLG